jgi:hypothetical protein
MCVASGYMGSAVPQVELELTRCSIRSHHRPPLRPQVQPLREEVRFSSCQSSAERRADSLRRASPPSIGTRTLPPTARPLSVLRLETPSPSDSAALSRRPSGTSALGRRISALEPRADLSSLHFPSFNVLRVSKAKAKTFVKVSPCTSCPPSRTRPLTLVPPRRSSK